MIAILASLVISTATVAASAALWLRRGIAVPWPHLFVTGLFIYFLSALLFLSWLQARQLPRARLQIEWTDLRGIRGELWRGYLGRLAAALSIGLALAAAALAAPFLWPALWPGWDPVDMDWLAAAGLLLAAAHAAIVPAMDHAFTEIGIEWARAAAPPPDPAKPLAAALAALAARSVPAPADGREVAAAIAGLHPFLQRLQETVERLAAADRAALKAIAAALETMAPSPAAASPGARNEPPANLERALTEIAATVGSAAHAPGRAGGLDELLEEISALGGPRTAEPGR